MASGTLPHQKSGKDFLASSHFTIGMDARFNDDTKSSAHKLAFQPQGPVSVDQVPAKSLGDSQLMHSSSHRSKQAVSQTRDSYQSRGVATREWNNYSNRLNTNFLSHTDPQCLSFETTAQEHFKPENALKFDKKEQKSLMTSSVPTGDKEKIAVPLSEVRDSYKGQSVDHIKPNRYPDYINYGIIDTLKTDRRKPPPYQTTNQELHSGQFDPANQQQYGQAALKRGTHAVGLGNETIPQHSTNVRDAYVPQEFVTKRYSKAGAVSKVLGTTFLFGSEQPHDGNIQHTDTTSNKCHTGESYGPSLSMKPENVFHSSFPEGDRDAERTKLLQNDTSYGEHFPNRAPGVIINPKVKGEEIITRSRVEFGTDNPKLSASTSSCYTSQSEHIKPRDRVDQLVKFRNGFSLGSHTEYRSAPISEIKDNFKTNQDHQKFSHKATVLGRLKDSHLILSHDTPLEYSTTYNSLFQSKKADPQGLAPKLQTSSVPLGNFSRYTTRGQ